MDCPVCKSNLAVLTSSEEILYDCPSCASTLLIKDKNIEILNKREVATKAEMEENLSEKPQEESEEKFETANEERPQVPTLDFNPEKSKEENESLNQEEEVQVEAPLKDESLHDFKEEEINWEDNKKESKKEEEFNQGEGSASLSSINPSEEAGGEGLFFYNLKIGKINSKELIEEIDLVLQDEILNLDPKEWDVNIKDGILNLKKLSPVKAHIIVKALTGLPLKISWEQHLVIDSH